MTNQPRTDAPRAARTRTWPRILVAAALAISGAGAILYAGFLPLPPFSNQPLPTAWQTFGAVELIAAIGVYLGRAWGRWLAVVVIVIMVLLNAVRAMVEMAGSDPTPCGS